MQDLIARIDIDRLQPHCLRLWPIIQQHPPGSAGRTAITRDLNGLPAADRHICYQLLDRMERVISFKDAWFPFYLGEVDTITPPVKAKRVFPTGPTAKQVWKDTRARQGTFARRERERQETTCLYLQQFVAKILCGTPKQPLGEQNQMAQTVRLDDDFIADVKIHASAAHRSLPKQIEYWAKIGRMVEDNPDLPFSFIKDVMLAAEQVKEGQVTRYVRRTKRD